MFFFPEETTVRLNDKDFVSLGAMSYVSLIGGYTLTYYDTTTGEGDAIELEGKTVTVVGENLEVNVSERYFKHFSNKILLHSPNSLNPVFKTIDK